MVQASGSLRASAEVHSLASVRKGIAPGDASDGASLVSLKNIGFTYGGLTRAIDDISIELLPGETLSVVGPSGCGKSTLLRIVAGLRQPTDGTVVRHDFGRDRHDCSMVFQEDTLLPWLTVEDNVALYYRFNGARGVAVTAHVAELLKMVKLTDYARFYPYQLSGGMRRRVAVLTAIAPQPHLLLLDEPFSALDEPTRIAIHTECHMLLKRLDITAVLVTHDLAEAISLSDRVIILSRPPAVIVEELPIPFGSSRNMYDLRDNPEFLELYGRLWRKLKEQIT